MLNVVVNVVVFVVVFVVLLVSVVDLDLISMLHEIVNGLYLVA